MKALISVYDKTGVVELARALQEAGYGLVSTGGTHRTLTEAGLTVEQLSDVTGSPEMLDGRVKTLHPVVHGGLLARRDLPEHMAELQAHGIETIDVLVGNLYPFEATVSREGVADQDVLENIDIGGPTMLRAAAKNHPAVTVVVDPADFGWVAERILAGGTTLEERRRLAATAFAHVSFYDSLVAGWMRGSDEPFPKELTVGVRRSIGAAVRREPAPARGAVRRRPQPRRRGGGRAAARQGALIQQHPGRRRRVAGRQRVLRAGGGGDQAHQPVRAGRARGPGGGVPAGL